MQIRFSTCRGMEIVAASTGELVGYVLQPLIEPDKGLVLGFYVVPGGGMFSWGSLYLSAMDIQHFGARITVRDDDVIGDPADIVRLQPLLEDPRTVLGQRIRTETGKNMGRCADIQFTTTDSMHVTWLFPRKWFRWRTAIPVQDVLEVRPDAILIRDPAVPAEPEVAGPVFTPPTVPDPGA